MKQAHISGNGVSRDSRKRRKKGKYLKNGGSKISEFDEIKPTDQEAQQTSSTRNMKKKGTKAHHKQVAQNQ